MKFQYDPQVDALYILMASGKLAQTEQVRPDLMVDYDENGKILGIEMLDISKNADNPWEMVLEIAGSDHIAVKSAICSINVLGTFQR